MEPQKRIPYLKYQLKNIIHTNSFNHFNEVERNIIWLLAVCICFELRIQTNGNCYVVQLKSNVYDEKQLSKHLQFKWPSYHSSLCLGDRALKHFEPLKMLY